MILNQDSLLSVDKKLVELCFEVGKTWDLCIVCGFRNQSAQEKAFKEGKSKLQFPHSKHNSVPSKAVDVASYDLVQHKIDWEDKTCQELREYIDEVARSMRILINPAIKWDLLHLELKG